MAQYMDKAGLQQLWDKIKGAIDAKESFLAAHPVGAIYITTEETNPGTLYGGIWVAYEPEGHANTYYMWKRIE